MTGGTGGRYGDDDDEGFEADDSALGMAMGEDERRVHQLQRMLKVLLNELQHSDPPRRPTTNCQPPFQ